MMSGTEPGLVVQQMVQVVEAVASVLFCPKTQFLLRFTDIHRDASVFTFGYIAPKHLEAVALPLVHGFPILRVLWPR
jgi:hypothetical protein